MAPQVFAAVVVGALVALGILVAPHTFVVGVALVYVGTMVAPNVGTDNPTE